MARSRKRLGEILVKAGVINASQAEQAIKIAQGAGKRMGDALVEAGFAKDTDVAKALADQFGMEFLDLTAPGMSDKVDMTLVPEELIRKHGVLPMEKTNGKLKLIMHDPMDLELMDMLRFRLSVEVEPKLASKTQIRDFIEGGLKSQPRMVGADESLMTDSIDRTIDRSVDRSMDRSIDVAREDAPVVKLVDRILNEACTMRASDIHIEPMADRVRLRYRIDGVCMERDNLPKRMQNAILSRTKLMSSMNIAERRVPQDGRIKIPFGEGQIDFRVSACPAYHGESVVLRILRPESARVGLNNLGLEQEDLNTFNRIIRRPNGIFLVTGPTGSGKTTTLYSALDVLNRPDRKIITAEDPVEYNFEGINQCQVRESIGLSFTAILRSMLRQAPNVILVGEIRDKEVAEIAIQAALTGHLVFSTLHTNDAPSAITRLIDMGIKPFLVASSIQAVLAQRLVRILCDSCKVLDEQPDPKHLHLVNLPREQAIGKVYKAVGCSKCNNVGYKGRRAIFELMQMNATIRDLAFNKAPSGKIRAAAISAGMKQLVDDGRMKILAGRTTPEEVARVAQAEDALAEAG